MHNNRSKFKDFKYCHSTEIQVEQDRLTHWVPMKTFSSESVIAVKSVFLWQSLGDHADVTQGLVFYIVLTGCLCVFGWLGNELTTEVGENIHLHYSSSINGFFCHQSTISLGFNKYTVMLSVSTIYAQISVSSVLCTYLLSQIRALQCKLWEIYVFCNEFDYINLPLFVSLSYWFHRWICLCIL